ncbi:MAG TPA: beta-L-arabinofuranosidase domain-containing protein [Puia sp.]|nr:beta-L-arabinofuranosidase domain-containing protein [Puia sp.]
MKKNILIVLFTLLCFSAFPQSYVPEKSNSAVKVKPVANLQAYAFNLKDVRLLNSPFKNAMEKDAAYLLSIDPDRLLFRFYEYAGLPTKGEVYGGWESEGLSGHTLGHYLSACSMMYASTGNRKFLERVNYLVDQLAKCQDAKGTGYIGAIPRQDSIFGKLALGEIKTSGFDLNGGWSPWYTVHKVMAGLLDAYLYCDNQKALGIDVKMADWTENTLKKLNEEQLQKMLACEFGGMNEVLVNIYSLTGNKKYLGLSYKFQHKAILDPLAAGKDPLPGKHSNTQIPKIIGCARRYELQADDNDKKIAENFWDIMVHHHSYVIGGNSDHEYLAEPDKLSDFLSESTCETCNTYNMLKLTRHLFCWHPDSKLADYYERALYNHILSSQNPETGMMCYFVPLRMGTKKQFSDQFNTFTCCVGSGMENHSKYTESIYYEGSDGSLFVNLFIPSVLNWKEKKVTIEQESAFPYSDTVHFTFHNKKPAVFSFRIRKPWWAKNKISIAVNDKQVNILKEENGYIIISRNWANNDRVRVVMPMSVYTESMPDNPGRIAFLYGPLVLAGDLGQKALSDIHDVPVVLTGNRNVSDWIKPVTGQPLTFITKDVGKPADITLTPFFTNYNDYYSVYWDYFTNEDWVKREAGYEAEKKRKQDIENRTIDVLRIGEMQPERDHDLKSENSYLGEEQGKKSRNAHTLGYFSFNMKVDSTKGNILLVTYWGGDNNRIHDILVDGTVIITQELKHDHPNNFFDMEYAIPSELVKGKSFVVVKFQAHEGKTTGDIYGCRVIKK